MKLRRTRPPLVGVAALALAGTVALVGCGADATTTTAATQPSVAQRADPAHVAAVMSADRAYLISRMHQREQMADMVRTYVSYAETMPNIMTANGTQLSKSVVVGHVTRVEKGIGYDPKGPGLTPVDFDDSRAQWMSAYAHVAVDSVVAGPDPGSVVTVRLSVYPNEHYDKLAAGLKDLGSVVLPLAYDSHKYEPGHHQVVDESLMFATVDADGTLDLPFTSDRALGARMLAGTPTLAALRAAAARPVTTRSPTPPFD